MVSRRRDYAAAKQYIINLTDKYAGKIVPEEVTMRIKIRNIQNDEVNGADRGLPTIAYATGNKDGTKALLVYDSTLIKTNMYNTKSKFFDALAIHELCHIRHGFEEPGIDPKFYHSRPMYTDCFKKYSSDTWAANSQTHPDRYTLRAYLGSEDKVVPTSIHKMVFYSCKECGHAALWNLYMQGTLPQKCDKCESTNITWTALSPFDTYRIAVMNEIDNVPKTAPARWFVYDRIDF